MHVLNGLCPYGHEIKFLDILGDSIMIYCPKDHWMKFVPVCERQSTNLIDRSPNGT